MSVPEVLFIIALVISVYLLFTSQGRSLIAWATGLIALGLLWPLFIK